MDGESEPEREVTRVPTEADLVSLARELNRLGVAYVIGDCEFWKWDSRRRHRHPADGAGLTSKQRAVRPL